MDVFVESIHETIDRLSRPVAAIEEFDLEPPEEPFHRGVVGRAALLRHGARDSVSLAPLDPAGPSVMTAALAVADGVFAFRQLGCLGVQYGVHELGVERGRLRPGDARPIEAINYGA